MIIENTKKAREEYEEKNAWESDNYVLTQEEINALLDGKAVAFDDGEYAHFLSMSEPSADSHEAFIPTVPTKCSEDGIPTLLKMGCIGNYIPIFGENDAK